MRLVFAGTPGFAATALRALLDSQHEIVLVLTQPDRPGGRGMRVIQSEVKQLAMRRGLQTYQPQSLKTAEAQDRIRAVQADAMVVAAYGLLLPGPILEAFPLGCINIHASLLPRWRGAAPIQRAILAGDDRTGISIMRMERGLDTGPVYLAREIKIEASDTAGTLHDKLAALGARCIVEALPAIAASALRPAEQDESGASYARKIDKDEAVIDWSRPASEVERKVRAFNPIPGASSMFAGAPIKFWRALAGPGDGGDPGRILESGGDRLIISCGAGTLSAIELQRAGGKRLHTADFLRGISLATGTRFGN
jgi:methionyl-tRNA formyltransferase